MKIKLLKKLRDEANNYAIVPSLTSIDSWAVAEYSMQFSCYFVVSRYYTKQEAIAKKNEYIRDAVRKRIRRMKYNL